MNFWLEHPTYVRTRDRLIKDLQSDGYRFRKLAPVIFLCGGMGSTPRDTLCNYLSRKYKTKLQIFYAESVWVEIAARTSQNALEMEAELAALADLLIIIVESPGTFAELGAFSLSTRLRKKLLPVVDPLYKNASSFIMTGPLRWIDDDSHFSPTVYAPLIRILEMVDEIEERISRIEKPRSMRLEDLTQSPKHLLFFMTDLISVIYPATFEMIEHYLTRIIPSIKQNNINIPMLIGLGVAMNLIKRHDAYEANCLTPLFVPAREAPLERPYHHRRLLDLPSRRAEHVAALMTIPLSKAILESLGNHL